MRRRLSRSGSASRPLPRVDGRSLRLLAFGVVAAGIALPLARRKLRLPTIVSAAAAGAAPVGMAIAVPRSAKRDVAVYALQMWAFIVIHELPNDDPVKLESRTRIDYPIAFDERVFGKSANVVLQGAIGKPGRTTRLDTALTVIHWAWFLQPHASIAWILWRHQDRFDRSAAMMLSTFNFGMAIYFLVPTAPPWWASDRGRFNVRRIMVEVGERVWGRAWPSMYDFLGGNPVAAMPSLHFGSSVMAAHLLADVNPVAGALGWTYATTLGFALVYLGEHYTVDLLAGLALTEAIRAAGPRAAPQLAAATEVIRQLESRARV